MNEDVRQKEWPARPSYRKAVNFTQEASVHLTEEEKAKTNISPSSSSVTREIQIKQQQQKEQPLYSSPEGKKFLV